MLKFTIDTPDEQKDNKIAVLDLKVQINEKENYRLDYEYFEKATKHPNVILSDSALSMNMKRTILTQECLRIPLAPMGVLAPGSAHARPSARPPMDTCGNFPAHVSAESPSNISPNPSEVISKVSEP